MTETTPQTNHLRERLTRHSVIGAELPPQGMAQTIPELMLLCFSCGWMRASEYDAHLLPVVAQEIAAAEQRGRDEVRARVEAVAADWRNDLDGGRILNADARYCWEIAHREVRTALTEPAAEEGK